MRKTQVTLGSLTIEKGLQTGPFGSQLKAEEYSENGIPVVMPKDIYAGHIISTSIARVPETKALKLSKHRLRAGDILFSRRGDLGRIGVVTKQNEGWLCGTGCLRARLKNDVNTNYIHQYVQLPSIRHWLESHALGQTMLNLNTEIISDLPIYLALPEEQEKISILLSEWDTAIKKTKCLIAAKEKRYYCLLSRFVCSHNYIRGQIREFASEVSKRNTDKAIDLVLSVTNHSGFVLPSEQFERRLASNDLSNYKVVLKKQYAYNPSRINVGSIARLDDWEEGVLSPMYVVFEINENRVDSDFFLHWLSSHDAKDRIRNSTQGSVRETVSFANLGAVPFPLPPLKQQKRITELLNAAKHEINLLNKLTELYRRQKLCLMQKLLTGQWRIKISEESNHEC